VVAEVVDELPDVVVVEAVGLLDVVVELLGDVVAVVVDDGAVELLDVVVELVGDVVVVDDGAVEPLDVVVELVGDVVVVDDGAVEPLDVGVELVGDVVVVDDGAVEPLEEVVVGDELVEPLVVVDPLEVVELEPPELDFAPGYNVAREELMALLKTTPLPVKPGPRVRNLWCATTYRGCLSRIYFVRWTAAREASAQNSDRLLGRGWLGQEAGEHVLELSSPAIAGRQCQRRGGVRRLRPPPPSIRGRRGSVPGVRASPRTTPR
jgi:hypothetical protein